MVALGPKVAGLFSTNDDFAASLIAACKATGERVWRLPLDDDYKEQLKSNVADLKNVGGKWGGAITAAKFLEQFVDGKPWAHLDIAGPSWSDSDNSTRDAGGTGCFVRTLVALLESRRPERLALGLRTTGVFSGVELAPDSAAVHIQIFQDIENFIHLCPGKYAPGPRE